MVASAASACSGGPQLTPRATSRPPPTRPGGGDEGGGQVGERLAAGELGAVDEGHRDPGRHPERLPQAALITSQQARETAD